MVILFGLFVSVSLWHKHISGYLYTISENLFPNKIGEYYLSYFTNPFTIIINNTSF